MLAPLDGKGTGAQADGREGKGQRTTSARPPASASRPRRVAAAAAIGAIVRACEAATTASRPCRPCRPCKLRWSPTPPSRGDTEAIRGHVENVARPAGRPVLARASPSEMNADATAPHLARPDAATGTLAPFMAYPPPPSKQFPWKGRRAAPLNLRGAFVKTSAIPLPSTNYESHTHHQRPTRHHLRR